MPKFMPFPIDLSKYESVDKMSALQFGIFARLIFHYWKTGSELPEGYKLFYLAKCEHRQWSRFKHIIFAALREVMPEVIECRGNKIAIRFKCQAKAHKTNALRRAKIKDERLMLSDQSASHTQFTALPEKFHPYHEGQFDPLATSNKPPATGNEGWLKDK